MNVSRISCQLHWKNQTTIYDLWNNKNRGEGIGCSEAPHKKKNSEGLKSSFTMYTKEEYNKHFVLAGTGAPSLNNSESKVFESPGKNKSESKGDESKTLTKSKQQTQKPQTPTSSRLAKRNCS